MLVEPRLTGIFEDRFCLTWLQKDLILFVEKIKNQVEIKLFSCIVKNEEARSSLSLNIFSIITILVKLSNVNGI